MLQTIAVRGYRSLRDIVLPLGRLSVVTGANGTGKSSVYRALRLLADCGRGEIIGSLAREGGLESVLWAGPETTWSANPQRFAAAIRRRIRTVFPALGRVELADVWSGVVGQTVHGMPQIGQLRRGLWVASGFGRQGMSATALAGQLIANGILWRDDRWRLFSPFELVWAGGRAGRVAGKAVDVWTRGGAAAAGALARWRERAAIREAAREARLAAANRQAGTGH